MKGLRKIVVMSMPAIFGLCIVLFLGSQLSKSVYHEQLTQYGVPICSIDRHKFESDTCEACGASLQKSGVFFSSAVAIDKPYGDDYQLSFADFYENWEMFKADYDMCFTNSIVVLVLVVFEVGFYIFLCVRLRKGERKAGGRLK